MSEKHPSDDAAPADEESLARRYAQHVAPTLVTMARRAVDLAEIEPGHSVLDLRTGTGLAAFLAAEKAGRDGTVIGLDESAAMLGIAQERSAAVGYDHIKWQQGVAQQLTYADESFDVVLCVHGLMLLDRPDSVLEEVRRVLVEDGRVVVTIWGAKAANEWIGLLEDAVRHAGGEAAPPRSFPLSQPGNVESLLQATGFQEIEVARVPDRMRFQDPEGLWQWARAVGRWGPTLDALSPGARDRVRTALDRALAARTRGGEVAISREIVYARAVAPSPL